MEMKNPYIFLGKINQMSEFDEMILFITEEKNSYLRKRKRIRFVLSSVKLILITTSIVSFKNHPIVCSIVLISSFCIFPLIFYILNKNNKVNRYNLVLNELKNEELKRNRFRR